MIEEVLRKIKWEVQEDTRNKPTRIHLPSSNGYENKGYVDTLGGRLDGAASYFRFKDPCTPRSDEWLGMIKLIELVFICTLVLLGVVISN
jgi:hypothetical protein